VLGSPKVFQKSSPSSLSKVRNHGNTGSDDDETNGGGDNDDEPDIYFEPIVKLPEITNLTTGEENEDIVYKDGVKLFRFSGDQWKERGVGELKILKNRDTGTIR